MRKAKKWVMLLVALVMVFAVVLSACKTHKCGHECPECGKCMDWDCKDPACSLKCPKNHGGSSHVCGHVCPDCGKCLDATCTDPACSDKCAGGHGGTVDPTITVSLNKASLTLDIGADETLVATASNGGAVAWKSSDEDVAVVFSTGKVLALGEGTATITATAVGGTSATCSVNVNGNGLTDQAGTIIALDEYRAYSVYDIRKVRDNIGTVSDAIDAQLDAAMYTGIANVNKANTVVGIRTAFADAKQAMAECIPLAEGVFDFSGLSNEERTKILGIMEGFAIRTGLTGTTLFENGGYQIYNDRVTLGTENYINGYGFGTMAEGNITADLATEGNAAWKRYYHSLNASNPNTVNYLNDQGSETGDLYDYFGAAYYTTFMNSTKDGYVWTPELALADPVAVNPNAAGQATTWRIELNKELKYNTLGKHTEFNGRAVALEDFITPFKLLLNQGNQLYRGSELANQKGAAAIVGAASYYAKTAAAGKGILDNSVVDFDSTVGVRAYEENGKWWFEYTLSAPATMFYSRYYINSSLYMPIPKAFIDKVGVDNYLGFASDLSSSPVDNSLSLGAYTLELWNDQEIVYKKNPYYVYATTKYAIPGVHIAIVTAVQSDNEAAIKEWEAGRIDACRIPDTKLDQYKNDPRTRVTIGNNCFKLNMNALSAADWEKLFGTKGTVTQNPTEKYWDVKPAMSNAHFRSGLSYALNREEFATTKGYIASADFFSPNYMSDPENGIYYYTTDAHKQALSNIVTDNTDQYGYSLTLARDYFRMALDELEAAGAYTRGTKENPTVITLQIAWQFAGDENDLHKYIKQYWEDAFNHESVSGGCYKLEVEFWVGSSWMDVYNAKMLVGQYDIGFGSISGNTLDPLSFFNVLSTDMTLSNSFTLNWAIDTSDPTADILVYNGMRWSWDALYTASRQPAIVSGGKLTPAFSITNADAQKTANGVTLTVEIEAVEGVTLGDVDFALFAGGEDYQEFFLLGVGNSSGVSFAAGDPVVDGRKVTYTFNIPNAAIANMERDSGNEGVDLYVSYTIGTGDSAVEAPFDFFVTAYVDFLS